MRPLDLADPRLTSLVLRLALPSVAGLGINAAYQLVDALFLAHVSAASVAAVSLSLPILMLVGAVGHGLGVAASTGIGRTLGSEDADGAGRTGAVAMVGALVAGLVLALGLLVLRGPILRLLGAEGQVFEDADVYLLILGLGAPLVLMQIVCDFIAIGEGNSRFSMWMLLLGFGLNMLLDPLLIFAAGLGIAGAALATVISQVVVLLLFAAYFRRGASRVRPKLARLSPRRDLWPFVTLGLPVTATTVATALSFALLLHAAARIGTPGDLAAYGVALRFVTFATLPLVGFCLGAQPAISFAHGRGDEARARATLARVLVVAAGASTILALLLASFGTALLRPFALDDASREAGSELLAILSLQVLASGVYLPVLAYLQARERTVAAALVGLSPQGYLLAPLAIALPPVLGIEGVAWAPALAALGTLALALLVLRAPPGVPATEPEPIR